MGWHGVALATLAGISTAEAILNSTTFAGELSPTQWIERAGNNVTAVTDEEASYFPFEDIPASWDWGAVNGRSYLSSTKNQNIPQYCGACYAFATISTLADRIKIGRGAAGSSRGADVDLSVQSMLNCGKFTAGDCDMGSISGVYKWIMDEGGIPYQSCQTYEARDDHACNDQTMCRMCTTVYSYAHDDTDDLVSDLAADARPAARAALAAAATAAAAAATPDGAAAVSGFESAYADAAAASPSPEEAEAAAAKTAEFLEAVAETKNDVSSHHVSHRAKSEVSECYGVPKAAGLGPVGGVYTTGVPKASVSGYGFVVGERRMRAEILTRGPITCLIHNAALASYSNGIIDVPFEEWYDHAVEVSANY